MHPFRTMICCAVLAVSATAYAQPLMPDGSPCNCGDVPDYTDTLTGDWGGLRRDWAKHGVDLQAAYTAEVMANLSGGLDEGSDAMDNLDITLAVDGEKLFGLQGTRFFFYVLNNNGAGFNGNRVGAGEGVSNIEIEEPTAKLYEAWVEKDFWAEQASIKLGLYDLNSEFNVTDSSAVFINPTFGIATAYAATGENGPSIFPTTSVGARLKLAPTEDWVLQAAVLDGVPGAPEDADGTHVDFDDKDGWLMAVEAAYGALENGRVGIGSWWYTAQADHLSDVDGSGDPVRRHSHGVYGIAEQTLYAPSDARHLDGFVRMTATPGNVNQFDYDVATGVAYTGLFASRPEDVAGAAWHMAHNGDGFMRANPGADGAEWGVEVTYAAQVLPWLNLQPDVQYIHNPGTTPSVDDAWVVGLRTGIAL